MPAAMAVTFAMAAGTPMLAVARGQHLRHAMVAGMAGGGGVPAAASPVAGPGGAGLDDQKRQADQRKRGQGHGQNATRFGAGPFESGL
jgi:hypothetical protein